MPVNYKNTVLAADSQTHRRVDQHGLVFDSCYIVYGEVVHTSTSLQADVQ